eukprot:365288-Chlamydomonas_euryale.AAC.11
MPAPPSRHRCKMNKLTAATSRMEKATQTFVMPSRGKTGGSGLFVGQPLGGSSRLQPTTPACVSMMSQKEAARPRLGRRVCCRPQESLRQTFAPSVAGAPTGRHIDRQEDCL